MKRPHTSTAAALGFLAVLLLWLQLTDALQLGLCIPVLGLLWLSLVCVPLVIGTAIHESEDRT